MVIVKLPKKGGEKKEEPVEQEKPPEKKEENKVEETVKEEVKDQIKTPSQALSEEPGIENNQEIIAPDSDRVGKVTNIILDQIKELNDNLNKRVSEIEKNFDDLNSRVNDSKKENHDYKDKLVSIEKFKLYVHVQYIYLDITIYIFIMYIIST